MRRGQPDLRPAHRRRPGGPGRRPGRGGRAARRQWRGQDHPDPHAARAAGGLRRFGAAVRAAAVAGGPPADRVRAADPRPVRRPHRRGEPGLLPRRVLDRPGTHGRSRVAARVRPGLRARPAARGRAARGVRPGARARAGTPAAGRADLRGGPAGALPAVGDDRGGGRGGRRGDRDHAQHGGSRGVLAARRAGQRARGGRGYRRRDRRPGPHHRGTGGGLGRGAAAAGGGRPPRGALRRDAAGAGPPAPGLAQALAGLPVRVSEEPATLEERFFELAAAGISAP